jgi:hypothetical protein
LIVKEKGDNMDVSNNLNVSAGMFAFNKAKEVKNNQVLAALGMTPQTEKAQETMDNSIKESISKAIGKGSGLDIQA